MVEVFRIAFLIVMTMCIMFSMNVKISLVAVVFIPIIVFYSFYFQGKISHRFMDADIAEGQRIGVQGTPYFLINNLVARGALSSDLFKEAINMALQAAPSGQK